MSARIPGPTSLPPLPSALLTTVALLLPIVACGPGDTGSTARSDRSEPSSPVRDSAGIRIVEHARSPDTTAGRLDLLATYGDVDGPGAFGSVADVAVDPAGNVLILDRQAGRVTVWDRDGNLRRAFGRKGRGPGELTNPNHVAVLRGGRILVGELFPAELHWYEPDGTPVRDERLELVTDDAGVAAILAEWRSAAPDLTRVRLARVSMESDEASHVVVDVDGDGVPGDTLLSWTQPGATPSPPPIFAPSLSWDLMMDGRLVVAPGEPYEIRLHDRAGRLSGIVRRKVDPAPVTRDLRRRAVARFREGMKGSGAPTAMLDAMAERVEVASTLPAIQQIRVSRPEGTVWVAVPRPAADDGDLLEVGTYDRYAPDGSFLGRVEAPPGFRLMRVVDGVAYGVWRGPRDVDFVRAYRYVPGS